MPRNAAPRGNFQYFPEQIETYFDHFSYRWTTEEGVSEAEHSFLVAKIIHKMTFSLIPARTSCNTPWANGARTTSDARGLSGARTSFTPLRSHKPSIETVRTELKPSRQYWNCPDRIETVRTELKLSGQYWNRPDSIETVRTVLKPSGQYWNRPDRIKTVRTELEPSGQN